MATFTGVTIDMAGTFPLDATFIRPDGSTGSTFRAVELVVSPGAPAQLEFVVQPSSNAQSGQELTQQPKVVVEDIAGNIVTTENSLVIFLSVVSNSSSPPSIDEETSPTLQRCSVPWCV